MADRLLVPKKKRPKSKWMQGFVLLPPKSDIDKVTSDRIDLCTRIKHKRIQLTGKS